VHGTINYINTAIQNASLAKDINRILKFAQRVKHKFLCYPTQQTFKGIYTKFFV